MSTFQLKCPQCGIDLEADENDIGEKVSCEACNYDFILKKESLSQGALEPYPDRLEDLKIGRIAHRGMQLIFSNPAFDAKKLDALQTVKKSKELFGFKWPLLVKKAPSDIAPPMFDKYVRHWRLPLKIHGNDYFLCSQWFEYHRERLVRWFQNMGVTYEELRYAAKKNIEEMSDLQVRSSVVTDNATTENATVNGQFSFDKPPVVLTYAKPYLLTTPEGQSQVSNWSNVLLNCCGYALKHHPKGIESLLNHNTPFRNTVLFATKASLLRSPREITDGIFIEMNHSAHAIIQIVCGLIKYCELQPESFSIAYSVSKNVQEPTIASNAYSGCIQRLLSLNVNKGNQHHSGASSHKPVMCITLIYAIDRKLTSGNLFSKRPLLPIFQKVWNFLDNTGMEGNIWIPFKYLVNDGFWTINNDGAGSFKREMYEFLSVSQNRIDAVNAILNTFFKRREIDAATLWDQLSQSSSHELPDDTDEIEKVRMVFNQNFQSGIRPGSIIDKNRFKRYYSEETGSSLSEDFPFETLLPKIGILHDGKVFPLLSTEGAIWRKLVDELLKSGHCLLAYSRVMQLHAQELMASGITSAEMLHNLIVHDASETFEIGSKYFAAVGSTLNLADVIATSIPENTLFVSETELCRQHPYICEEDIHHVLVSDMRYVWNCRDIYVVGNRLTFDESETDWVLSKIRRVVSTEGYCSLVHFDFTESMYLNDPEITIYAVRRVFFSRYLANEFDKHGQIVSCKGEEIDGRVPLREFCRKHSEVTLEQIYAVANDFNITGYLAMATMHEEMVRVELERFAAPSMVTFDIASIDHVIDTCFPDKVMPFGAFRDFSQFPAVPGWSWNLYLLEAFLRRSSRKFRLLTPSAASREVAGVVVRKDDAIDDVLDAYAMVAGNAGLPDDDDAVVGDYLQKNGCILRRRASMVAAITARLKMIYEGMK